jgi:hypothetical protein
MTQRDRDFSGGGSPPPAGPVARRRPPGGSVGSIGARPALAATTPTGRGTPPERGHSCGRQRAAGPGRRPSRGSDGRVRRCRRPRAGHQLRTEGRRWGQARISDRVRARSRKADLDLRPPGADFGLDSKHASCRVRWDRRGERHTRRSNRGQGEFPRIPGKSALNRPRTSAWAVRCSPEDDGPSRGARGAAGDRRLASGNPTPSRDRSAGQPSGRRRRELGLAGALVHSLDAGSRSAASARPVGRRRRRDRSRVAVSDGPNPIESPRPRSPPTRFANVTVPIERTVPACPGTPRRAIMASGTVRSPAAVVRPDGANCDGDQPGRHHHSGG